MNNTSIKKLNINTLLNESSLTAEEDAKFKSNVDMLELERGVEKAGQEIANREGIEFREAMAKIHKEIFGEKI